MLAGPIGHGWYGTLDTVAARFIRRGTPQFILAKVPALFAIKLYL